MSAHVSIIGGGAAGLSAAVFLTRAAARRGLSLTVTIWEKSPRVGRRLLATGNGTCNITNREADLVCHYHGGDPTFAKPALSAFPPEKTMDFFASIGVLCQVRPDGRAYPVCEQAAAVLDALRLETAAAGVTTCCDAEVSAIRRENGRLALTVNGTTQYTDRIVVAAGGASAPSLGGGTDGYALLTACGHRRMPLFPSLVPVRTDSPWTRSVKGLRATACVCILHNRQPVIRHTAELLFADYGLSGPAALAVSRPVGDWERQRLGEMTAQVDLLPSWDETDVRREILRRRDLAGRTLGDLLTGLLHKRIGQTVVRASGVLPLERPVSSLTDQEADAIAHTIKGWSFPIAGTRGLAAAQVTAGGICTDDVDPHTMQSRLVRGLYAVGEILDIDGDCGGFNLQWAWSSAHAAAEAVVAGL